MNQHTLQGELASPITKRQAGKGEINVFRVMTEEQTYKGEPTQEEHVFETFDHDTVEPLKGAGVGSLVKVEFRLRSRPWKDRHFTTCAPTKVEVVEAVAAAEPGYPDDPTDDLPF